MVQFFTVAALGFLLFGCSNKSFTGSSGKKATSNNPNCDPLKTATCGSSGGDETLASLKKNEVVLAVRDISCAMCHAQIESNVITDFAKSTTESSSEQTLRKILYQVNHADGDAGQPVIQGRIIVPNGNFPMLARTTDCLWSVENVASSNSIQKTDLISTLKKCVEPKFRWSAASEKFVGKDKVAITPISSPADIKALVTAGKLIATGMATIGDSKVNGIVGNPQSGFKASTSVTCEGAVVFDGPVVLKDSVILTEKGCRIYSTASIFILGSTKVSGPEASANLQLMSPLFVGFDISLGNIEKRLTHENTVKLALSRGSTSQVAEMIKSDMTKSGVSDYVGSTNVGYSRIAAAAPVVYARHSGTFSGVIIAEHFIGKIGALSFRFDPVFKSVETAIFPEIKRALVVAE